MSGAVRSNEELWGAGGDNDITIITYTLSSSALLTFILVRMEPVLFLQEGLDVEDSEVPALDRRHIWRFGVRDESLTLGLFTVFISS